MTAHRPTGPITINARGECTKCHVPMVRNGAFIDCERCGRTVHVEEVRR